MIDNSKTLPYGVDPPGIVAAQEGMRVVTEKVTSQAFGITSRLPIARNGRERQSSFTSGEFRLLQLCVLHLGFFQNGDVGVGVFPEGKKIFVGYAGLILVGCQYVGASKLQMCQRADGVTDHDPAVIEDFLELDSGLSTLVRRQ